MKKFYVVSIHEKKFYFIRSDSIDTFESFSVEKSLFTTHKDASVFVDNFMTKVRLNHDKKAYSCDDENHKFLALADEKGRIFKSYNLKIECVHVNE